MGRMPGATWKPIGANYVSGTLGPVAAWSCTIWSALRAWRSRHFNTPGANASAHFGVTYGGTIYQYVDTADVAYHACQANWSGYVGVENESPGADDPSTPEDELWIALTPEQVSANPRIADWLADAHGMALRVADPGAPHGVGYTRDVYRRVFVVVGLHRLPGDTMVEPARRDRATSAGRRRADRT